MPSSRRRQPLATACKPLTLCRVAGLRVAGLLVNKERVLPISRGSASDGRGGFVNQAPCFAYLVDRIDYSDFESDSYFKGIDSTSSRGIEWVPWGELDRVRRRKKRWGKLAGTSMGTDLGVGQRGVGLASFEGRRSLGAIYTHVHMMYYMEMGLGFNRKNDHPLT